MNANAFRDLALQLYYKKANTRQCRSFRARHDYDRIKR